MQGPQKLLKIITCTHEKKHPQFQSTNVRLDTTRFGHPRGN